MKVIVYVSPKATVLDPQVAAVEHAMKSLGHGTVRNARIGKTITFEMDGKDNEAFRKELDELCDGLLSNPIIEDFRYEIEG